MERPDAIVIGSGLGGLAAAAALAKAGKRPLILEHHFQPGGNAQAFRRRKMFDFDVGLHLISGCEPGGDFNRVLQQLDVEGVEFLPMNPDAVATIRLPDLTFRVPADRGRLRERLHQAFPTERVAIDRYLDYAQWVVASMEGRDGEPPPVQRLLAQPWTELPLGALFDALEFSTRLRHLLAAAQWVLNAAPPSRAPLAAHLLIIEYFLRSGGYYVRGGSRALIDGFLRAIERGGGQVRLRSRVARILIEDGRAVGVRLAKGEEFRAPLVISNADAKRSLLEMVGEEHLSPALAQRVRDYRMALPLFIIYMAMQVPPEELRLTESNILLLPRYTLEEDYEACCAGRVPERPLVFISITSLKDPESVNIAPPGYTNLQLMTVAPAQLASWGVAKSPAGGGRYRHTADYVAAKTLVKERILAVVDEMMPGFIRRVVWEECATPLTQERFTLSTGGTSYGFEQTPDQFFTKRLPFQTEVPGLYLCGANTLLGGGIMGAIASGAMAGQAALAAG